MKTPTIKIETGNAYNRSTCKCDLPIINIESDDMSLMKLLGTYFRCKICDEVRKDNLENVRAYANAGIYLNNAIAEFEKEEELKNE